MATYTNKNGTNDADTLTYNKAGTYNAYNGKDTINITGGSGVIVHTGAGNNTIKVTGGSGHTIKSASTEAEGEKIVSADKLTIGGADMIEAILGSGRDEIILNTTNGRKSDGSLSKIKGGSWTDTFTVNSGAEKYQLYGEAGDDVFNIAGGSNIVCWGGAANDTFNVTGGTGIKLRGGDSADVYNISTAEVDIQLGYGNDIVNVTSGDNQQIKANLGINTINLTGGKGHIITADIDQAASKKVGRDVGYGVDKLNLDGASSVTANLGDGKDIVKVSYGSNHEIYTEGWGDTVEISGTTSSSRFDTGDGDDLITVTGGSNNSLNLGTGNDTVNITGGTVASVGHSGDNGTLYLNISGTGKVEQISVSSGDAVIDASQSSNAITKLMFWLNANKLEATLGSARDILEVTSGSNHLVDSGAGNDEFILGKIESGTFHGGAGKDILQLNGQSGASYNKLYGDAGEDSFIINGGNHNTIFGGDDNDAITLKNNGTENTAYGGNGDDDFYLRDVSSCYAYGDDGEDIFELSYIVNSYVYGGADKDTITLGTNAASNKIYGGAGDDEITLKNNSSYNTIYGDSGRDIITLTGNGLDGKNKLYGGEGLDTITVQSSDLNTIDGGTHADTITVGAGRANIVKGGTGADKITLQNKASYTEVHGEADNDTIIVSNNANYSKISGGAGNDTITFDNSSGTAHTKECFIYGGSGDDTITLGSYLEASTIIGGNGNDTIIVGSGSSNSFNKLVGGAGNDTYRINMPSTFVYIDATVSDSSSGELDTLEIYVNSSSFTLKKYKDYDNKLMRYVNKNDEAAGSILFKYTSLTNLAIKFYDVADFGKTTKTEITTAVEENSSSSSGKDLSSFITSFGADTSGDSQYSLYSSLESFIEADTDLKISGNT